MMGIKVNCSVDISGNALHGQIRKIPIGLIGGKDEGVLFNLTVYEEDGTVNRRMFTMPEEDAFVLHKALGMVLDFE